MSKNTPQSRLYGGKKNLLLRIIGIVVLFLVGLAAPATDTVLGAAWLDIWWACLVVPVALVTGIVIR